MTHSPDTSCIASLNMVEALFHKRNYTCSRQDIHEIHAGWNGRACHYQLCVSACDHRESLEISAIFDYSFKKASGLEFYRLLARINQNIPLGHFDFNEKTGLLYFRHALSLKHIKGFSERQVEDFLDNALETCEQFYPAFEAALWSKADAQDIVTMMLMQPAGHA